MATIDFKAEFDGILTQNGYKSYLESNDKMFKKFYASAVEKAASDAKVEARNELASKFKVKNKAFVNAAVRTEVFKDPSKGFATLHIFSKISWFHAHENNTVINKNKKLIMPIGNTEATRKKPKVFRKMLSDLFKTKDFFFKKINGTTILFAKITKQNSSSLTQEKRFYNRKNVSKINGKNVRSANYKKLKVGDQVPIGVCLDQVRLKKRYNIEEKLHNKTLSKILKYFEENVKKG